METTFCSATFPRRHGPGRAGKRPSSTYASPVEETASGRFSSLFRRRRRSSSQFRIDVTAWFRHHIGVQYYIDSGGRVHGPMNQQHSSRLGAIQHTAGPVDGSPYAEVVRDTTISTAAPRVTGTRHSSPGANQWQVSSHDSGFSSSTPGSAKPRSNINSAGAGHHVPLSAPAAPVPMLNSNSNSGGAAVGLSVSDARELDRLLEELRVAGETAVTSVKRSQSTRTATVPVAATLVTSAAAAPASANLGRATLSGPISVESHRTEASASMANSQPSFRTSITRVHQEIPSTSASMAPPVSSGLVHAGVSSSMAHRDQLGYESEPEGPSSYFRRAAAFGESPTERELRLLEELKNAQEELLTLRRQQNHQEQQQQPVPGRRVVSSGDEVFDINLRYSAMPHQAGPPVDSYAIDFGPRRRHHSQQEGGYFDEPRSADLHSSRTAVASGHPAPFSHHNGVHTAAPADVPLSVSVGPGPGPAPPAYHQHHHQQQQQAAVRAAAQHESASEPALSPPALSGGVTTTFAHPSHHHHHHPMHHHHHHHHPHHTTTTTTPTHVHTHNTALHNGHHSHHHHVHHQQPPPPAPHVHHHQQPAILRDDIPVQRLSWENHVQHHTVETDRHQVRSASVEPQPFPVDPHLDRQRHNSRSQDIHVVQRSGLYDRPTDFADAGDTKLAELERSLQAASDKIYRDRFTNSYSAHRENQKSQQHITQTHHKVVTKKDEAPGEIYEEIETVTLQPIGKGVHDLESAHQGIGRTLSADNCAMTSADQRQVVRAGGTLPRQRPVTASAHVMAHGTVHQRSYGASATLGRNHSLGRLAPSAVAQFGTLRPGQHRLLLASGAVPGQQSTAARTSEGNRAAVTQSMDRIHQMGGHQVWSGINNAEPVFQHQQREDHQRAKTPQPRSTNTTSYSNRRRHMSHEYMSTTDALPAFEVTPPSDASTTIGYQQSTSGGGQKIPVHTVPISVNTNTGGGGGGGYHYQVQASPPQPPQQSFTSQAQQIQVKQIHHQPQQHQPPAQVQQQQHLQQLQLQQQQLQQQQQQLQQLQQQQQQLQQQQQQVQAQQLSTSTVTTGTMGTLLSNQYQIPQQSLPQSAFGTSTNAAWSSSSYEAGSDGTVNTPKFVRDTSKFWYKPSISREEAINLLRDKSPGSFVVRDSNSFPNAFGLAVKVAHLPHGVTPKTDDVDSELVRHFLIEPTSKGVRLKGCSNEPVFGSLTALIYQHTLTALALPCRLVIPQVLDGQQTVVDGGTVLRSPATSGGSETWQVLFLGTVEVESMTGSNAVVRSIDTLLDEYHPGRQTTECQLKLSADGVTLTDTQRKLFFRRHYQPISVSFCGIDPKGRSWSGPEVRSRGLQSSRIFGLITRKQAIQSSTATDNVCHVFCELQPGQPSVSIVSCLNRFLHR